MLHELARYCEYSASFAEEVVQRCAFSISCEISPVSVTVLTSMSDFTKRALLWLM